MTILKKEKNFDRNGFTEKGFVEYGKLRSKGIKSEKAIGKLIKNDKRI